VFRTVPLGLTTGKVYEIAIFGANRKPTTRIPDHPERIHDEEICLPAHAVASQRRTEIAVAS